MTYVRKWSDFPEVEVVPNIYRTAVSGLNVGVNRIRWTHPTSTPLHLHSDTEQVIVVVVGTIELTVADETYAMREGDVAVIPINTPHSSRSLEDDAVFFEVFAPLRIQNLVGFIGKLF